MDLALLGVVTGLGLVDSLNPFTVAAQAYLLTTPRPLPRSTAFLLATFATYLVGGVALVAGLDALLASVGPLVPAWALGAAEAAAGLALGIYVAWSWRRPGDGPAPMPPLGLGATVAFAVLSTASDLPSAVPLFAAAARISAETGSFAAQVLWLAWDVLIYCLPLIALVGAYAALSPARREALSARVAGAVD